VTPIAILAPLDRLLDLGSEVGEELPLEVAFGVLDVPGFVEVGELEVGEEKVS
jgi:hypothetical protein